MILRLLQAACLLAVCVSCRTSGDLQERVPQGPGKGSLSATIESVFQTSSLLVLGEHHGTNEGPRAALAAVDAALAAGHRVTLGLEVSEFNQGAFDLYLASPGSEADRAALVAAEHWEFCSPDGRGSLAMLELVEGMRERRAAGADVAIHCFVHMDFVGDPAKDEKRMADLIIKALESDEPRKFVVLVGSLHASTAAYGESIQRPMGQHLLMAHPWTVNLRLRMAGGEAWAWIGTPGIHPAGGTGDPGASGIELFDQPDERGFRGAFDIGTVTASLPVKPGAYDRMMQGLGSESQR